jgi:hypothetical protein
MGPAAQAAGVSARGFAFLGFAIIWICIFGFSINIWIGRARTQFHVRACNFQMFSEFTSSGFKGRSREVSHPSLFQFFAICCPVLQLSLLLLFVRHG